MMSSQMTKPARVIERASLSGEDRRKLLFGQRRGRKTVTQPLVSVQPFTDRAPGNKDGEAQPRCEFVGTANRGSASESGVD